MNDAINVRPARNAELPTLAKLIVNQLPDMMDGKKRPENIEAHLARLIPDQSLIIATAGNRLAGLTAVDLDHSQVLACYLDPETASPETPRQLFRAAEKLALSYGARHLYCTAKQQVSGFMNALGYTATQNEDGKATGLMQKDLLANAKPELKALLDRLDELGLPKDYGLKHRMRLVPEASTLVPIGRDIFDRDQRLTPAAATAWTRMQTAASGRGIDLQLVSAFRTVSYQSNLFKRKLDEGQNLHRVLTVTAAPGYSEHHSGRAIDLTSPGQKPLEEEFAETKAYQWLKANAGIYGFKESYPRNNRHRIQWEPWHWCYHHRPGT
ncbi:MAG: M15 family metallopeptidase [Pseudomonadota bacterium]